MVDRDQFSEVMRQIVASEYPLELESFDQAGPRLLQRALDDQHSDAPSISPQQFQFIAEASSVLVFVQVLAATVLALKKVYDNFAAGNAPDTSLLQEVWRLRLIEAGIDPEKASAIALRFTKDLVQCIGEKHASIR